MRQVGIFGKRKSGKSTLMYALTRHKMIQDAAFRAMEISGMTRVMLVDTVSVDVEDDSTAEQSAQSVEVALMLITNDSFELELAWISKLRKAGSSVIVVISKADEFADGGKALAAAVEEVSGLDTLCVSSQTGAGIVELDAAINRKLQSQNTTTNSASSNAHALRTNAGTGSDCIASSVAIAGSSVTLGKG